MKNFSYWSFIKTQSGTLSYMYLCLCIHLLRWQPVTISRFWHSSKSFLSRLIIMQNTLQGSIKKKKKALKDQEKMLNIWLNLFLLLLILDDVLNKDILFGFVYFIRAFLMVSNRLILHSFKHFIMFIFWF